MIFKDIPLDKLAVNQANDRHGEQGSEEAAIRWLLENKPKEMQNLIVDIAQNGGRPLDPPLVKPVDGSYVVYDGNRRVSALKLLQSPDLAPENMRTRLQNLNEANTVRSDSLISCQVEKDQSVIDQTLSRRHGGTDNGRGQLKWDTRAKEHYAKRLGIKSQYPIAEAVENFLKQAGYPRADKIKRSTLYRLINTKARQAQFGISLNDDGELSLDKERGQVTILLSALADDIVEDKLTLKDVLNNEGINRYLDEFQKTYELYPPKSKKNKPTKPGTNGARKSKPRSSLIPRDVKYEIDWKPRQGKIQKLWEELTFCLSFGRNDLSIPVTFRALIELTVKDGIDRFQLKPKGTLGQDFRLLAQELMNRGVLSKKETSDLERIAIDNKSPRELEALHRALHSSSFTLSQLDLLGLWDSVEPLLLATLEAKKT